MLARISGGQVQFENVDRSWMNCIQKLNVGHTICQHLYTLVVCFKEIIYPVQQIVFSQVHFFQIFSYYIFLYKIMQNLKKALVKDDIKKYKKNKIELQSFKKSNKWANVGEMIDQIDNKEGAESHKKSQQSSIFAPMEQKYLKIIEKNFYNGQINNIELVICELLHAYRQTHLIEVNQNEMISSIIERFQKIEEVEVSIMTKKLVEQAINKIKQYQKDIKLKEKEKGLSEFKNFSKKFTIQKNQKKTADNYNIKLRKQLLHSTSAQNLKIKFTREEYLIEDDSKRSNKKKQKSLDVKNKSVKSKNSSTSNFDVKSMSKLHMFFKDTNKKVVKNKVQYDYSAILAASKTNIKSRNQTYVDQERPKNSEQTIGKVCKKKNQGFVFYRPKKSQK